MGPYTRFSFLRNNIKTILVRARTSSDAGAAGRGKLFLGIGGREFRLHSGES